MQGNICVAVFVLIDVIYGKNIKKSVNFVKNA